MMSRDGHDRFRRRRRGHLFPRRFTALFPSLRYLASTDAHKPAPPPPPHRLVPLRRLPDDAIGKAYPKTNGVACVVGVAVGREVDGEHGWMAECSRVERARWTRGSKAS